MTTVPPSLSFLRRHARVWLDAARVTTLTGQADETVVRHARRGLPFVMRRVLENDPPGGVPLALRLPTGDARRGLSFSAPRALVVRAASPLSLSEALGHAVVPRTWRAPLTELDAAIAAVGVTPHVYGSLAWECMTGARYLYDGSDVDLLLRPASPSQAHACLELLREYASVLPLDGEIELPDGSAVAWKELAGDIRDTHYVLVKSARGVALMEREAIWHPRHWN